ncbi:MAG: extracellular solute-binding protein [Nitrospiraceae bacterium]|nr:MAG: extracellular solute-binding protein [Nitrospiraceae bacterium]
MGHLNVHKEVEGNDKLKEARLKFLRFHCLDRHHCAVQYHHLVDGIIKRFEAANPHVKIESTIMRNWYQLMHILNKKLHTDETPDIFHTCGGGILEELSDAGLVYDLTHELDGGWRKDFVPASLQPLRFHGKDFAIPLEQGCIFVWYNKKIFKAFGFSVPKTFDDLLYICRELAKKGIVPFTVGNGERWPGAFFFSHLFHRIGGEEVFVSDFTKASNYDHIRNSFIAAASKLLELVDAGAFHKDCNTMDYYQQRMMLVEGKAAMQINGNRLLNYLLAEGPAIIDSLDIFSFPLVDGGRGKTTTLFGGSLATYAVSEKSGHKREAVQFLKCLTDRQAARDVIFNMGDIPALTHVPFSEYPSAVHARMAEELSMAENLQVHYFKYLPPHAAGVYLNIVAKLFEKEITPEEAFKTVEQALAARTGNNVNKSGGIEI